MDIVERGQAMVENPASSDWGEKPGSGFLSHSMLHEMIPIPTMNEHPCSSPFHCLTGRQRSGYHGPLRQLSTVHTQWQLAECPLLALMVA